MTRRPGEPNLELLLDTHLLIWAATDDPRLSSVARDLITNRQNTCHFSSASIWEIAIKSASNRSNIPTPPAILRRALRQNDYQELPITSDHILGTISLPPIHKDPFDRILIAQATHDGLLLITHDKQIAAYDGPIRLV